MNEQAEKTVIREDIEWISIRWHNAPDTTKKRVLLVGDSIVVGHGTLAHKLMEDELCIDFFATAKHVTDVDYMDELLYMMSRRQYELIIFNNGLHGFDIDDNLYKPALQEALTTLKEKTPRLCWRTSTPILTKGDLQTFNAEKTPRVLRRNADAADIAKKLDLPILDLYTPMSENKHLFSEDAIHYKLEGQQTQAQMIADFIREQLTK